MAPKPYSMTPEVEKPARNVGGQPPLSSLSGARTPTTHSPGHLLSREPPRTRLMLTWIWVCTCCVPASFWAWEMGVVRNCVLRAGWVA